MKSGGSNLTQQHAEDLSLCALFLMEASKRVAHEFGAQSHSTRDANKDITNVVNYFLEKKVAHEIPERTSIGFKDPTDDGLDKMCNITGSRTPYPEQGVTTTWKKTQYMSLQNVIKIMNYLMSLSLLC